MSHHPDFPVNQYGMPQEYMTATLIVDDDEGIRTLLTRWLQTEGYTTLEADSAEAALDLVAGNDAIGVVICDLVMPGNGGLWLVQRLRKDAPAIALVLGTANDEVPAAVSLRDGVVAYVVKPFSRKLLLHAVAEAVHWHLTAQRGISDAEPRKSLDTWLNPKAG